MKQNEQSNGDLKPERKKTTNRTTMVPTTGMNSHELTIWAQLFEINDVVS